MAKTFAIDSATAVELVTRKVVLRGICPVMFDRYPGDNDTKLTWSEKVYLTREGELCLPAVNLRSFYTAHNTNSAPKRLRDKRKFKDICNAIQSFTLIAALDGSQYIPFLRNGKPIKMGAIEGESDPLSGLYLERHVARLDKGIPNPKERPVLPMPWSLEFQLSIIPNSAIKESEIRNLTAQGGLAIGIGTFRGVYGKFLVDHWGAID